MSMLWSDLRFAVRALMKARGFSVAAIAALALGIGPNTAIFSVVYATLLAPLPFPQPDQLVMVWAKTPSRVRNSVSSGDYLAWKESATSFQYLEAFSPGGFNLATSDEPLRVRVRRVTPDGHRLLGEGVALGRDFLAGDDQPAKNQITSWWIALQYAPHRSPSLKGDDEYAQVRGENDRTRTPEPSANVVGIQSDASCACRIRTCTTRSPQPNEPEESTSAY